MSNLSFFEFGANRVRTSIVNGNLAFCLRDVLLAMGTKLTAFQAKLSVVEALGEVHIIVMPLQTPGGEQDVLFVLEAGLTFLLARSRTEIGKQLNRLIHTEILPSLRKTGRYSVNSSSTAPEQSQVPPKTTAEMLVVCAQQLVDQERRIQSVEAKVEQIEQRSIDAAQSLKLLPAPTETAPPLTERDSLRKLINAWCQANNIPHQAAWRTLYNELYLRDGFSVNARIKNSKAASKLELVAQSGKLGILYAIASEIFVPPALESLN